MSPSTSLNWQTCGTRVAEEEPRPPGKAASAQLQSKPARRMPPVKTWQRNLSQVLEAIGDSKRPLVTLFQTEAAWRRLPGQWSPPVGGWLPRSPFRTRSLGTCSAHQRPRGPRSRPGPVLNDKEAPPSSGMGCLWPLLCPRGLARPASGHAWPPAPEALLFPCLSLSPFAEAPRCPVSPEPLATQCLSSALFTQVAAGPVLARSPWGAAPMCSGPRPPPPGGRGCAGRDTQFRSQRLGGSR